MPSCGVKCLMAHFGMSRAALETRFPNDESQGLSVLEISHFLWDRSIRHCVVDFPIDPERAVHGLDYVTTWAKRGHAFLAISNKDRPQGHWVYVNHDAIFDPSNGEWLKLDEWNIHHAILF